VLAALSEPKSERVTVEILRALGDRIAEFQPQAGAALARLETPNADLRTRFLLIAPTAELAASEPAFRVPLARTLRSDPDPHFRAQALSALKDPADFTTEVTHALGDPDMRVREAAVHAGAGLASAAPALVQRLADDPWPLVRIAAADALSESAPSAIAEPALARALDRDDSPNVRAHVVLALGAHHAIAQMPKIRERLTDKDESPLVRAAAAQALAALCDASSVPTLTAYAQKLADPLADANDHLLGAAALLALGALRPSDLAARLEPLRKKGAPPQARQAADAVLLRRGACGKSASAKEHRTSGLPAS
jgi:HEAT repeat protein